MELEQIRPKKPNFALIFALFVGTMFLLLLAAIVLLHFDARRLIPHANRPGQHVSLGVAGAGQDA